MSKEERRARRKLKRELRDWLGEYKEANPDATTEDAVAAARREYGAAGLDLDKIDGILDWLKRFLELVKLFT